MTQKQGKQMWKQQQQQQQKPTKKKQCTKQAVLSRLFNYEMKVQDGVMFLA